MFVLYSIFINFTDLFFPHSCRGIPLCRRQLFIHTVRSIFLIVGHAAAPLSQLLAAPSTERISPLTYEAKSLAR